MIIKFEGKNFSKSKCICNNPNCLPLRQRFQKCGDLRGHSIAFPTVKETTNRNEVRKEIEKWQTRAMAKLGISSTVASDTRDRSKSKATKVKTRIKTGQEKKIAARICLHHFDPKVLQCHEVLKYNAKAGRYDFNRNVPVATLERLGMYKSSEKGNYDSQDTFKTSSGESRICVLPSYPFNNVTADINECEKEFKENATANRIIESSSSQRPKRKAAGQSMQREKRSRSKIDIEKEIEELRKENEELKQIIRRNGSIMGTTPTAAEGAADPVQPLDTTEIMKELLTGKDAGLNRLSVSSDSFHSHHPNLARYLFGFDSIEETKLMIEALFDIKFEEPKSLRLSPGESLSEMEQIMMTMMWGMLGINFSLLGIIFGGIHRNTVSIYINKWCPVLGERGDMLSELLPFLTETSLDELEPFSYKELGLRKIGLIVDGKDFSVETCRIDRVANCAQHSNKIHGSAFRLLTWSLPLGTVVTRTPAFLGRASEKAIMAWWGLHGCLNLPKGYLVLGDKGFDNTAGCYVNFNTTLHPAFLTNDQFNLDQAGHNVKICQKRYTCEVVYSRVTNLNILYGTFKRQHFHLFESLVGWAHGRANLCYEPLQPLTEEETIAKREAAVRKEMNKKK